MWGHIAIALFCLFPWGSNADVAPVPACSTDNCPVLALLPKEIPSTDSLEVLLYWDDKSTNVTVGASKREVTVDLRDGSTPLAGTGVSEDLNENTYKLVTIPLLVTANGASEATHVCKQYSSLSLSLYSSDSNCREQKLTLSCGCCSLRLLGQIKKPMFKPLDTMEAHVFCFDAKNEQMEPCGDVRASCKVTSPENNDFQQMIFQFKSGQPSPLLGPSSRVGSYSYGLGQKPALGTWTFTCKLISDEGEAQTDCPATMSMPFKVEEYVAPTFKVSMTSEPEAYLYGRDNGGIEVCVSGEYILGNKMSGADVIVDCTPTLNADKHLFAQHADVHEMDANGQFCLSLSGISEDAGTVIQCNARVFVQHSVSSEVFEEASMMVKVTDKEYEVEQLACLDYAQPGSQYCCMMQVTKFDGSGSGTALPPAITLTSSFDDCGTPVPKSLTGTQVELGKAFELCFDVATREDIEDKEKESATSSGTDSRFVGPLIWPGPREYDECMGREHPYSLATSLTNSDGEVGKSVTTSLKKFQSDVEKYLNVQLTDKSKTSFAVGDTVGITVGFTGREDIVVGYAVKCSGRVTHSASVSVTDGETSVTFAATPQMVPGCYVVFVATYECEILGNGVEIQVTDSSLSVSLQIGSLAGASSQFQVRADALFEPGEQIALKTTSNFAGFLLMLGMDNALISMAGDANTISQAKVLQLLRMCADAQAVDSSSGDPVRIARDVMPPSYGGDDDTMSAQIIIEEEAGFQAIRTGYKFATPNNFYYAMEFMRKEVFVNAMPMPVPENDMAGPPAPPPPAGTSEGTTQRGSKAQVSPRRSFLDNIVFNVFDSCDTVATTNSDKITQFSVYATCVGHAGGVASLPSPATLKVAKDIFVQPTFPYSLKRYESSSLVLTVCNYLPTRFSGIVEIQARVPGSFDRYIEDGDTVTDASTTLLCSSEVEVEANECAAVKCACVAKSVGTQLLDITLRDKGTSNKPAIDVLEKPIIVKPEGCEVIDISKKILQGSATPAEVEIDGQMQYTCVADSGFLKFRFYTAMLAPALDNPDKLVVIPHGCGEQNMITFAPQIPLVDYLTNTQDADQEMIEKAKENMGIGASRELTYKRSDGGFSAFGNSDPSSSSWLTAFVVESYAQLVDSKFASIETKHITEALVYLFGTDVYEEAGSGKACFKSTGKIIHTDMQGGATTQTGGVNPNVCAYILKSVSKACKFLTDSQKSKLAKAVRQIEEYMGDPARSNDPYFLSVAALALYEYTDCITPANDMQSAKDKIIATARDLATLANDDEDNCVDGPMLSWSADSTVIPNPCKCGGSGVSTSSNLIETTGYVLMVLMLADPLEFQQPVEKGMAKLNCHQTQLGGYSSTQDTVIGLRAIAMYAKNEGAVQMSIEVLRNDVLQNVPGQTETCFPITQTPFVTQIEDAVVGVDGDSTKRNSWKVRTCTPGSVESKGKLIVELVRFCNKAVCSAGDNSAVGNSEESMEITYRNVLEKEDSLQTRFSLSYSGDAAHPRPGGTGMAILTVSAPTGFSHSACEDGLGGLVEGVAGTAAVALQQVLPEENKLTLYLDELREGSQSFEVRACRKEETFNLQDSEVSASLFYNQEVNTRTMYGSEALKGMGPNRICLLCDEDAVNAAHPFGNPRVAFIVAFVATIALKLLY